jgi:glycosidase
MLWDDDQDRDLLDFYRQLIKIRKSESALTQGKRETVLATEETLAYRRMDGDNSILCLFNISEKPSEVELEVAESNSLLMTNSECRIQIEGRTKRFFLPPFSGMIIK